MKKMKRYFLLVTAAMLLGACNSETDETEGGYVPSGEAIAFEANEVGSMTRAGGEITTDALKNLSFGFGVFACYTGKDAYENVTVSSDFMYNQQVKWVSSAWTYAPVKYWSNNAVDRISFFAYAPYQAEPDGSRCIAEFSKEDDLGDPWLVYKLAQDPWSVTNGQTDLLYGVNNATGLPWYDQQKSSYDVNKKIEFTFKHALACIGDVITVQMDNELNTKIAGYATITFKKLVIEYTNLTSKARLVLNSRNSPNWKSIVSGDVTTTRTYTKMASFLLTTDAQTISEGDGLFYIPLQVSTDKQQAVITVYYIVNNGIFCVKE